MLLFVMFIIILLLLSKTVCIYLCCELYSFFVGVQLGTLHNCNFSVQGETHEEVPTSKKCVYCFYK